MFYWIGNISEVFYFLNLVKLCGEFLCGVFKIDVNYGVDVVVVVNVVCYIVFVYVDENMVCIFFVDVLSNVLDSNLW